MSAIKMIIPLLAVGILTGCTESEQSRARNKAEQAGQEIKEGLKDVKEEAKEAGAQLKDELKEAGDATRRGIDRAGREIKKGIPDNNDADRRRQ
jgi:predicted phage-related endonuclease